MDKRFIFILIAILLLSPMISAIELNPFADKKIVEKEITADMSAFIKEDFNADYGVIKLSKTFFWFESDKIAEYSLTKNTETCFTNCEAEGKVVLYSDGAIFDNVKFKSLKGENTYINSYKYLLFEGYRDNYVDVPTYKEVCLDNKNGTKSCSKVVDKYVSENQKIEIWNKYNGETLKAGSYRWKIQGNKRQEQFVDFIPIINDHEFSEWAFWNSSLLTKITHCYNFNADSGSVVVDKVGKTNGTFYGTPTYIASKNGNGAYFDGVDSYIDFADITGFPNGASDFTVIAITNQTNTWATSDQAMLFSNNVDMSGSNSFSLGLTDAESNGRGVLYSGTGYIYGTNLKNYLDAQKYTVYIVNGTAGGISLYSGTNYLGTTTRNAMSGTSFRIGHFDAYGKYLKGTVDGFAVANVSLSASEMSDLASSYGSEEFCGAGDSNPNVTSISPANNYVSSNPALTLNCSITDDIAIKNATMYINNAINKSYTGDGTNNATNLVAVNTFADGSYEWNCTAYDYINTLGTRGLSRTFLIDSVAPAINIISPTSSYVVYSTNENISLNFSITHSIQTLSACYFNTSYNATINLINCSLNSSLLYPATSPNNLNITLYSNDTAGNIGSATVSINRDLTPPSFTLISLNNVSTISLPINATINVTSSDTNLAICSYTTTDNSTETIYTCNTTQNILFLTGGIKTINITANDTIGNTNSILYYVGIYDFNVTQTGSATASDGSSAYFTLLINSTSFPIGNANANLWYNGVNQGFTTKTILNANAILFGKTISIPSGTGNATGNAINWLWNYNTTELTTRNTTTQVQTVYNVSISDCALTSGRVILNLSLKDEELNSLVDIAVNNATIEIDMDVTSLINSSQTWQFYKKWEKNNSVAVCVPYGLLNSSTYKIDFTIGYDATDHVKEFYYLENGTLDNSAWFNSYTNNTIDLMDLLTVDSTTFLFTFTDTTGLEVDNAIVHTFRKYIGEGVFREVERSKQDNNGQTHVHLVEEDVIYYFMITQYGNIIYTSDTYNAKCLSSPCSIELSASQSNINWSILDNVGGLYAVSSDRTTRIVTTSFNLETSGNVNVSLYKFINGTSILINSSSLTAMSGSIDLTVPITYGNTTFYVSIANNGEHIKSSWVDLTTQGKTYFGLLGAILGGLIVLSLLLMAVSEGIGAIVFTGLALIIISIMKLVDLGWLALISIICAGGIIIFKLTSRSRVRG